MSWTACLSCAYQVHTEIMLWRIKWSYWRWNPIYNALDTPPPLTESPMSSFHFVILGINEYVTFTEDIRDVVLSNAKRGGRDGSGNFNRKLSASFIEAAIGPFPLQTHFILRGFNKNFCTQCFIFTLYFKYMWKWMSNVSVNHQSSLTTFLANYQASEPCVKCVLNGRISCGVFSHLRLL